VATVALEGTGAKISFGQYGPISDLLSITISDASRAAIETTHLGSVGHKSWRPSNKKARPTIEVLIDTAPESVLLLGLPAFIATISYPRSDQTLTLAVFAMSQGAEKTAVNSRIVTRIVFEICDPMDVADPTWGFVGEVFPTRAAVAMWGWSGAGGTSRYRLYDGAKFYSYENPAGAVPRTFKWVKDDIWIFSTAGGNIWRSTNGGRSWSNVFSAPSGHLIYGGFDVLGDSLTIGIYNSAGGSWRSVTSADAGANWSASSAVSGSGVIYNYLSFGSSSGVMVASIFDGGAWRRKRSVDGGSSWSAFLPDLPAGVGGNIGGRLARVGSRVFQLSCSKVIHSDNNGDSWTVDSGVLSTVVQAMLKVGSSYYFLCAPFSPTSLGYMFKSDNLSVFTSQFASPSGKFGFDISYIPSEDLMAYGSNYYYTPRGILAATPSAGWGSASDVYSSWMAGEAADLQIEQIATKYNQ
jgi:hypothetical protein